MRKPGFYWVRIAERWTIGEWFDDEIWMISGSEQPFYDNDFIKIIEDRLNRSGEPG